MSMENERLLTKIVRVEDDCLEKKRELEIYRGRCEKLERSKELDQGTDLKLINLRQDRDKLDSTLRESLQKNESFQNRIFEMEVQASNSQAVESELRRTLREKQDLAEQMTKLTKTNIEMSCELEKLSEIFKTESIESTERIRHLEENLRLIDSEKELYKDTLRRKEDVESRLRLSTDEIDVLKNTLYSKTDLCANLTRAAENNDRQLKFLTENNTRLSSALSESDGRRTLAEESLHRKDLTLTDALRDLEIEHSEACGLHQR